MIYDIAIIGGGPAGYTAAEKAAKAGKSVILFEKQQIGGVCLNSGCIPTKTLLYSAKLFDHLKTDEKYGIKVSDPGFDLNKIITRKTKIIRKLAAGIKARLKNSGVEFVNEEVKIKESNNGYYNLYTEKQEYSVSKILLATGSQTSIPPIKGIEKINYWTNEEALQVKEIPNKLVIIGGGVIGMEFASFFNSMGDKVSVIEMLPEILGNMDIGIINF